jgi:hypothetical protein
MAATFSGVEIHAASLPMCNVNQLSIKQVAADAGMSQAEIKFSVINTSGSSCLLRGKPRVKAVDQDNNPLKLSRKHTQNKVRQTAAIVLRKGDAAAFFVSFGTSNPYSTGQCPPAASALVISLPENGGSSKIDLTLHICTRLSVSEFSH